MKGSTDRVVHFHHHFTIYFKKAEERSSSDAAPPPLERLKTKDLLIQSQSQPGGLSRASKTEKDKHEHHHLFHHMDTAEQSNDEYKKSIEKKINDKYDAKVVHHYYESVENVDELIQSTSSCSTNFNDLPSFRRALRWALRIELATIPPYLYTLYSIVDRKSEPYKLLKSIAAEEMLHASLVANLLTALGGQVIFYDPKTMVTFPHRMPHTTNVNLGLYAFSKKVLEEVFLPLEAPSSFQTQDANEEGEFNSIGAFYNAILGSLEKLASENKDLFAKPRVNHQLNDRNYKIIDHNVVESGTLHHITCLRDARCALSTIVNQGEGLSDNKYADENEAELTHFAKLEECLDIVDSVEVYPCYPNPKTEMFPENMKIVSNLFNTTYAALMTTLQELFMDPDSKLKLNKRMYVLMEKVMRPCGQLLSETKMNDEYHCGPTFEPVIFGENDVPVEKVKDLVKQVLELFPDMEKLKKGLDKL